MTKTKIVKCPTCRGKKRIMCLGFSLKDCHECKAIGYVEEPVDELAYLESCAKQNPLMIEESFEDALRDDVSLESHPLKKRGRKKKIA